MAIRIKLDAKSALAKHTSTALAATQDRFAQAARIVEQKPTVFTQEPPAEPAPKTIPSATASAGPAGFDLSRCVIGSVVAVPLHLIDPNPIGPRVIYKVEDIDKIARTLPASQDDAAHGFVREGRVVLIDGGTRYRAAKISGVGQLDVKFEQAPESEVELYLRARSYNEQRSQTSVIDHALSLQRLLDSGVVSSARELCEKIPDIGGSAQMSESQVSYYLRVARMPRQVIERMSSSAATSQLSILYAVSEIFPKNEAATAEQIELGLQIVDEIKTRELTHKQTVALVKSRLGEEPKQRRERSLQQQIAYGPYKGQIKCFGKRGQVDLSLRGVKEEDMPALQGEIDALVKRFVQERSG
ncbi:ParB/RepB/Spo0J family partition protein [Alicycliphilus denitrificans]|uniref:ParB/RepB/Spo0J family partition protein n=1 Tax=Alicycliphilus denitrificans TaxID=179636 RepID=UPI0001D9FB59|nr:ParB/RepB/Spo0J family partition protein [Alicycliphilus denitrificans]ADV02119.1 hypothetical protein Alide_4515 [Alicycliphilus denitrificans BC]